jgi:outer membrane receptor for ferrienterochelin and colicins
MSLKKLLALFAMLIVCISIQAQKNKKTLSLKVRGNCEECKDRIEKTLQIPFIYKATWDIESELLKVSFDSIKISKQVIQQKLAKIGHESEGYIVDKTVYDNLPNCCQYGNKTEEKEYSLLAPKNLDTTKEPFITPTLAKDTLKIVRENVLENVAVFNKSFSTYVSAKTVTNTLNITAKELKKAACCNLSESFETSPSIDVSYTDAVTGIKQIQLLGLQGSYTQITTENVPELRGLVGSFGLTFIPGPFVDGIQLTKGTGSVANGFESIAGQINIEEKKPISKETVFVNTYVNNLGRVEATANIHKKINKNISTAFLLHGNGLFIKNDINDDGFLDNPTGNQINFINRWLYESEKGVEAQLIVKYLKDKRVGGSKNFDENNDKLTTNNYGLGIGVEQFSVTSKLGYVFKNKDYKSIGLMMNYTNYNNTSYYGLNEYNGFQQSLYANLIYQSIFSTTTHKYRTGVSVVNDNFRENFSSLFFNRKETIAGAFFEYTYQPNEKFTTVLGTRLDHHSYFGWFSTLRLNAKWQINKNITTRFTIGNGSRMANIFAENVGFLASSRQVNISPNNNFGYGFNMEKAWNMGFSVVKKFALNNRKGNVSIDVYRTSFREQVVTDVDVAGQISFYNLQQGKSFSHTLQIETNYEVAQGFDVRLAYRFIDAKTTYSSVLRERPLLAKHRAFINLAYETASQWNFDITANFIGSKRLPITLNNPMHKQMLPNSPSFYQLSAQVTKKFNKSWEVYVGAENLTNFIQQDLIIDAANPFSQYFDASMVWGPMNGRIIYFGLRYSIF